MTLKKFQITFIPKCFAHKDDPCDHKEWDYFEGTSKKEVLAEVRQSVDVLRCVEVPYDED